MGALKRSLVWSAWPCWEPCNDFDLEVEPRQPCHADRRPVRVGFFRKRACFGFQPDRELGFRVGMEVRHINDIVEACAHYLRCQRRRPDSSELLCKCIFISENPLPIQVIKMISIFGALIFRLIIVNTSLLQRIFERFLWGILINQSS